MRDFIRECPICGTSACNDKELQLFPRNINCLHGRSKTCKQCVSDRSRGYCIPGQRESTSLLSTEQLSAMKLCKTCGIWAENEYELTCFRPAKDCTYGYMSQCKDCAAEQASIYRSGKRQHWSVKKSGTFKSKSEWHLFNKYGIMQNDYDKIFIKQNGKCMICGCTRNSKRNANSKTPNDVFSVDHDHLTGNIRGLLCRQCNTGIGNFSDNEKWLAKAIEYLKKSARGSIDR